MRATRRRWLGWGALGLWVVLLVVVAVGSLDEHGRVERPPARTADDRFVAAWKRSREATYYAKGTFERHSDLTGSSIGSEDVVAQDPPRRLHRQMGGIEGRFDDRVLVCPSAPGPDDPPCQLGDPGGRTYAEDVAAEVASLRTLVEGARRVYSVRDAGPGCFALDQRRSAAGVPFGVRSRYCFDDATGALVEATVTYAGGIDEHLLVRDLRSEVREADFVP